MKIIFIVAAIFFSGNSQGQFLKRKLEQVKESARQKAEQRADQKIDNGLDNGINKTDSIVSGKKKIFGNKSKSNNAAVENMDSQGSNNKTTGATANENGEFIIKTNIKCVSGKAAIESLIRDVEGVSSATVDAGSGKLYLSANGDVNIYNSVVELIRKNGFMAENKKPLTKSNLCN